MANRPKPPTLAARVRTLEGFRYRMLGRVSALQTMLLSSWGTLLKHHSADPVAAAEEMRRQWLKAAEAPSQTFPGADPAHLDAVSQEYRDAIDDLSNQLTRMAHALAKSRDEKMCS